MEVRSWKLRCQQGRDPSETDRGILPCLILASGGLLAVFGIPWFAATQLQSLPLSLSGVLCVFTGPFAYKGTNHIGLGTHPTGVQPHLNIAPAMTLFPNKITFWGARGKDFNISLLRLHNSTHKSRYLKIKMRHPLGWLLQKTNKQKKTQKATNVGENEEKLELLCTLGENVKCCSYNGKLYDVSLKNYM